MDNKELRELNLLTSDRLLEALKNRDKELALILSKNLSKEFLAIHKNLWSTAEDLFHYLHDTFSEKQGKTAEEIVNYIKNEDFEPAIRKLEIKNNEHIQLHDLYLEIVEALQGALSNFFGEESLYQALRYTAEKKKFWFEKMIKLTPEDLVRQSADLVKHHMGHFQVTEDEEKFTFNMDPCGSGGRLWRRETQGGMGKEIYYTTNAHPQNLNQKGLPAYCTHCPVWNSLLPIEWFGFPLWVYELPKSSSESCKIHIFKNPENIPQEYFSLLGKIKGEGKKLDK
jgi:hypothetical protein